MTLPFWLLVLLAFFALVGLTDRIFVPGVRWFFRRRVNRAIDELNTRLQLRIQPFKLTRRQTLIDQLMYDQEVIKAVETHSEENNVPRAVSMAQAQSAKIADNGRRKGIFCARFWQFIPIPDLVK